MEFRTVMRNVNGNWERASFEDIKKGDKFMLFEADGTRVKSLHGNDVMVANSDAYVVDGTYGVSVEN